MNANNLGYSSVNDFVGDTTKSTFGHILTIMGLTKETGMVLPEGAHLTLR